MKRASSLLFKVIQTNTHETISYLNLNLRQTAEHTLQYDFMLYETQFHDYFKIRNRNRCLNLISLIWSYYYNF